MEENIDKKRKIVALVFISMAIIVASVIIGINVLNNIKKAKDEEIRKVAQANINPVDTMNYTITADGTRENISERVKDEQKIKNLVITNTKIVCKDGVTKLTSDVLNRSRETEGLKLKVIFLGNDSNVISQKEFTVGDIKTNETKNISIQLLQDVSNANFVKYEIID